MTDSAKKPKLIHYQIVVGVLAWAVACFAGLAWFYVSSGKASGGSPGAGALTAAAAVLLVGGFVAGLVVRRSWLNRLRSRWAGDGPHDIDELLPAFGTVTIVRGALAEAPAFLFLIVYMLSGLGVALAGAALALVALLAAFPTRTSYETFVNQALDRRDFGPR